MIHIFPHNEEILVIAKFKIDAERELVRSLFRMLFYALEDKKVKSDNTYP